MNFPILIKNRFSYGPCTLPLANGQRRQSIAHSAWRALSRMMKACAEGIAEARRMSRAYNELTALSDSELQDIGISRSDIPSVVTGTYRNIPHFICDSVARDQREKSPSPEHEIHAA